MQRMGKWMVMLALCGTTATVSAWWGPWAERGYNRGYGHYGSGLAGEPYGAGDLDGEADLTFEFSGWMNMDMQGRGDGYGNGYGDGLGQGRYWGAPGYGGYAPGYNGYAPPPHPGTFPPPYPAPPPGLPVR